MPTCSSRAVPARLRPARNSDHKSGRRTGSVTVSVAADRAVSVNATSPGASRAQHSQGRSRLSRSAKRNSSPPYSTFSGPKSRRSTRPSTDTVTEPVRLPDLWSELRAGLSLAGTARDEQVGILDAILPWFAHDALIHYLSPRGLEQYTGGGWGTRDVCQGPVGLLAAYACDEALRDVLLRTFRDQNVRGDWPQAFDFLPPDGAVGQWDAHGDVVYWPLLALGDYLLATGDSTLLTADVPSRGDGTRTPPAPIAEHARHALAYIESTLVLTTPLPAYGHGDWNDSLQPADPRLASQMASTCEASRG